LSLEALSCIEKFNLPCGYTFDERENEDKPLKYRKIPRRIFNILLSNTFLQELDLRGILTPRPFFCLLNIKSLILDGSSSILRVCKFPFLDKLKIRNDVVTFIPEGVKVLDIDKCKIRNTKFPDSLESIRIFESNGNVLDLSNCIDLKYINFWKTTIKIRVHIPRNITELDIDDFYPRATIPQLVYYFPNLKKLNYWYEIDISLREQQIRRIRRAIDEYRRRERV
jgi:hypothetical protein